MFFFPCLELRKVFNSSKCWGFKIIQVVKALFGEVGGEEELMHYNGLSCGLPPAPQKFIY